jgi:hypothetical protein
VISQWGITQQASEACWAYPKKTPRTWAPQNNRIREEEQSARGRGHDAVSTESSVPIERGEGRTIQPMSRLTWAQMHILLHSRDVGPHIFSRCKKGAPQGAF